MTNRATLGLAVAILASLALPLGCTVEGGSGAELTTTTARPWIADVPVPTGFTLVEERSRHWSDGQQRWVDHLYAGSGEKSAVIAFYEKQMPVARWTPMTNEFMQGQAILDYVKDRESCRIVVTGGGPMAKTYIKVAVTPKRTAPTAKK